MSSKLLQRRGQIFLGFVFSFLALVLLTVGVMRIWVWFNANTAGRSWNYQKTRLDAGGGKDVALNVTERPFELTKDLVFKGRNQGGNTFDAVNPDFHAVAPVDPTECCRHCCSGQNDGACACAPLTGSDTVPDFSSDEPYTGANGELPPCTVSVDNPGGESEEHYNYDCACQLRCECRAGVSDQTQAVITEAQIYVGAGSDGSGLSQIYIDSDGDFDEFKKHVKNNPFGTSPVNAMNVARGQSSSSDDSDSGQAGMLMGQANSLRAQADDCDDWWETCWWAGFGATAYALRHAADDMEMSARQMYQRAQDLVGPGGKGGYIEKFYACCELSDKLDQDLCITDLQLKLSPCNQQANSYYNRWSQLVDRYSEDLGEYENRRVEVYGVAKSCYDAAEVYCRLRVLSSHGSTFLEDYFRSHGWVYQEDGGSFVLPYNTNCYKLNPDTGNYEYVLAGDQPAYCRGGLDVHMQFTGGSSYSNDFGVTLWHEPQWKVWATLKQTESYVYDDGKKLVLSSPEPFTIYSTEDNNTELIDTLKNDYPVESSGVWCQDNTNIVLNTYCSDQDADLPDCDPAAACEPCTAADHAGCYSVATGKTVLDRNAIAIPEVIWCQGQCRSLDLPPRCADVQPPASDDSCVPCPNEDHIGCHLGSADPQQEQFKKCMAERADYCCGCYNEEDFPLGDNNFYENISYAADSNTILKNDSGGSQVNCADNGNHRSCYDVSVDPATGKNQGALSTHDADRPAMSNGSVTRAAYSAQNFMKYLDHTGGSGCRPWTIAVLRDYSAPATLDNYNTENLYTRFLRLRNEAMDMLEVLGEHMNPFEGGGNCDSCHHADNYFGECCECSTASLPDLTDSECDGLDVDAAKNGCNNFTGSARDDCLARQLPADADHPDRLGVTCRYIGDNGTCSDDDVACKTELLKCKQTLAVNRSKCFSKHNRQINAKDAGDASEISDYNCP